MIAKNTVCLWFDKDAEAAARFYAATFPNSEVRAVHKAPGDYPDGKEGNVLTVDFTVLGIPCLGLNGGPQFKHSEAFSFQIATDDQEETDRYWNAIVEQRREGERLRLVQGPLGALLANHASYAHGGHGGRRRGGQACLLGHDDDEEDRRRDHRRSPTRMSQESCSEAQACPRMSAASRGRERRTELVGEPVRALLAARRVVLTPEERAGLGDDEPRALGLGQDSDRRD